MIIVSASSLGRARLRVPDSLTAAPRVTFKIPWRNGSIRGRQAAMASDEGFRSSKIVRHYKGLEWPSAVYGGYFAGLSAICGRMRPKVSGLKLPFPKMVFVLGSSRPTAGRQRRL